MSGNVTLEVEKRNEELNPREVRAQEKLTGTIYGKGMDSVSIQFDKKAFVLTYRDNKDATFELKEGKNSYKTVVQNVQYNYALNQELNVEFKTV